MNRFSTALLIVALAVACTPRLDYLKKSAEFSHPAVAEGKIALTPAGCMVSPEKVSTKDLAAIRTAAVRILAEKRPKIPILTAQETDLALGEDIWNPLMTFTKTGALPLQDLETLATRAGVRFLGLLRVETWGLEFETEESNVPGEGGEKGKIAYRKRTWATMQLRLTVYDNKDGSLAWLGIHEVSLPHDDIGPLVSPDNAEAVAVAAEAAIKLPYPPPPAPTAVAEMILRRFFENFPEAK